MSAVPRRSVATYFLSCKALGVEYQNRVALTGFSSTLPELFPPNLAVAAVSGAKATAPHPLAERQHPTNVNSSIYNNILTLSKTVCLDKSAQM